MKEQVFLEAAKQWYRDYKVAERYHQFSTFVESLKRPGQDSLIESIQTGINTLTENHGYDGDALLDRLAFLYEAVDEEEMTDEEVADEMEFAGELGDDASMGAERTEERGTFGLEEQEEAKRAESNKEQDLGKLDQRSDRSNLRDKYSLLLGSKSKRPDDQFVKNVGMMAVKQAEQFSNPDVQEEVFGHLLRWALTQKKKLDAEIKSGEREPIDNMTAFIMKGTKPIFTKDKNGKPIVKKIQHSDLEKFKAGKKARGLMQFRKWDGSKPNYPHFVIHQGTAYELTDHAKTLPKGSQEFKMEPGSERADTIWEESTMERYKGAMSPVEMKSQESIDAPVGDSGEGDMAVGEKIAAEDTGEFQEKSATQLSRRLLDDINKEHSDKLKTGHLRLLNLIINNPDKFLKTQKDGTISIEGTKLAELIPEKMPGVSLHKVAGRPPRVNPESAKAAFANLKNLISSDPTLKKKYSGLRDLLDAMDEIG